MFLTTSELAGFLGIKATTIRRALSKKGSYFGLVPKKNYNGRLLWDSDEINKLVSKGDGNDRNIKT